MSNTPSKSRLPKPTIRKGSSTIHTRPSSSSSSSENSPSSHSRSLELTQAKEEEIAHLEERLAEVEASEQAKVHTISQLNIEKKALEGAIEGLKGKLRERQQDDEKWARLLEHSEEADSELARLKESFPELELLATRAEKEDEYIQSLKDQNDELDKQLNEAVVEGKVKDQIIAQLRKREEDSESEHKVKDQRYAELLKRVEDSEPKIKNLEFQLQHSKRQCTAATIHDIQSSPCRDFAIEYGTPRPANPVSSSLHSAASNLTPSPTSSIPSTPLSLPKIETHIATPTVEKSGLLSRLRGVLFKDPETDIRGPVEIVTDPRTRVEDHHAGHLNALQDPKDHEAQIIALKQEIKEQEAQIIALEQRNDCIDPAHKNRRDTEEAVDDQLKIMNMLLKAYEERLRERERQGEEKIEVQMGEEERLRRADK